MLGGVAGACGAPGQSCVLACELIVVSVSVYVEVHVCVSMRLGPGGGTSVAPGLPYWIQALGLGGGKSGTDLGSFPGFSCASRNGRPLAPQTGPAHPIRVSTEPVLCGLGPHSQNGWLSWDPKPFRPGK